MLIVGGDTVVQLFDPTGPLRLALPPLAFLLGRTARIGLRIPVLRTARAGVGLEYGSGLRTGSTRTPRLGMESGFLETAHQIGKITLQVVGQIGIAGAHSDPKLAGFLCQSQFHFGRSGRGHLNRDVFQRNGGGLRLGLRKSMPARPAKARKRPPVEAKEIQSSQMSVQKTPGRRLCPR